MKPTTLQIPINRQLRDRAKQAAQKQGFSSLQEMVRVFLSQMIDKNLQIGFVSEDILLSSKNEQRYAAMLDDANDADLELTNVEDVMKNLS